jgi:hypothetical protein
MMVGCGATVDAHMLDCTARWMLQSVRNRELMHAFVNMESLGTWASRISSNVKMLQSDAIKPRVTHRGRIRLLAQLAGALLISASREQYR